MYRYKNKIHTYCITIGLLALTTQSLANASSLAESEKVEQSIVQQGKTSQIIVNESVDKATEWQTEIDALRAEINGLDVYQSHLNKLIENQAQELDSLDFQLNEISETRQSIVPLMYEMVEQLEQHINNDMPIRLETRLARLEKLKELMVQATISDAEKYRRILEAYQIELDYVQKLDTYIGTIEIEGTLREVEQLYLGHVSFIARSLDAQKYWLWEQKKKQWVALEGSIIDSLKEAFLVANKRISPTILTLPLSIEGGEK